MLVRASSDCEDVARPARGLERALAGTAVTRCYSHYESGFDSVVETMGKQIVVTMVASTQRQVENIHSVLDRRINCVQDVFTARVQYAAWENVVVTEPRPWRDA